MSLLDPHGEPTPTGATFASLWVTFLRDRDGGLLGVWYHPNREAHDKTEADLRVVFPDGLFEVVEYRRVT